MNSQDKNHIKDVYLAKWLSDEICDDELKSFVTKQDYEAYVKIKNNIELFESPVFNSDQIKQKIEHTIFKKKGKVRKISFNWMYATAAAIAILVSVYVFNNFKSLQFQSKYGEQQNITLIDGSEVKLNAKSKLYYSKKNWKNKRTVNLQGEAFFKVKKGKSFTVLTKNGSVTVLGTQFNINSQQNFFNVMCYSGKVRVIQNKDTIYLTKGKAYQNNGVNIEKWNFLDNKPSWFNKESTYRSTPLKIVMKGLENQFGIKIKSSNIDENQIYTGSFSYGNLGIALKSVFLPMNIQYKIKNKEVFLSKK